MSKMMLTVAIVTMFILVGCSSDKTKTADVKEADSAMKMDTKVVYYGCPMTEHSHVASKEHGKCEECGMTLVPVVMSTDDDHEFYGCPMAEHSHVRSNEPGTCADCGMTLEPLKFKM